MMQRYEAALGEIIADKVVSCRGHGPSRWHLVTASGDVISVSHNEIAEHNIKVGDYLILDAGFGLHGTIKAAVFESLFRLKARAAA